MVPRGGVRLVPSHISPAVPINLLLFGFVGPFAAAMMDRWGIRPVVAALLFIAAGAAPTTLMTVPRQLYLPGIVVGLGAGTMATVLAATVANRWFVQRRSGRRLLTAATATGQLIFLPFFGWLAQERGWRYVSLTVALCTLAVVPLVLVFLRNWPEDAERGPTGPAKPTHRRQSGNPVAMAFAGWPWPVATAISGCWRRRSSSVAPRQTV